MRPEVARIVYPVLNYGLRLKERREQGQEPDLDAEQAVLKGLLNADEGRQIPDYWGEVSQDRAGEDAFLGIRYALTCWLDEILIDKTPWGVQFDNRKLEWSLFRSQDRGWKFRPQAAKADARQSVDAVEAWHYHAGAPLKLEIALDANGPVECLTLGADLAAGERPQAMVPAHAWQAAQSLGEWTLVGCTVAPGFELTRFEMAANDWAPGRDTPLGVAMSAGDAK